MRYFVVSDIHGHYDELINALEKSEFDLENEEHKLIVAGDMFDRGSQSKEVLEFLYNLYQKNKAIILKGNHEIFLEIFFKGNKRNVNFNIKYNGFNATLNSFIPNYDELTFKERLDYVNTNYPYLRDWINNLPFYFETDNFVITHAGLDFSNGDFKDGNFQEAVWIDPVELFTHNLIKEYDFNKIVIVGHRFTSKIRNAFTPEVRSNDIYFHHDFQKIAIDGGVYFSKQINVLDLKKVENRLINIRRTK